jgi:cytochrome o ubiquinol oxidase subunit IV
MSARLNSNDRPEASKGSYLSYSLGFGLSILLTMAAYLMVNRHVSSHHSVYTDGFLIFTVLGFALIQLVVQLVCFLHLGRESKPRWNLIVMSFAVLVVLILVLGSLWIMHNLNYHSAMQKDNYIIHDEGIDTRN